jgi:hypothetical protein
MSKSQGQHPKCGSLFPRALGPAAGWVSSLVLGKLALTDVLPDPVSQSRAPKPPPALQRLPVGLELLGFLQDNRSGGSLYPPPLFSSSLLLGCRDASPWSAGPQWWAVIPRTPAHKPFVAPLAWVTMQLQSSYLTSIHCPSGCGVNFTSVTHTQPFCQFNPLAGLP